ncbi:MAG: acetyl-CoA acetyltransferase [Microbacteriaceae bacterium]|nr:acetyl-CoA acetyltransferase [Microbacteriaceae bacterium]
MPEAVIVSAVRSPIGRAHKGSMATIRPDDLVAQITRVALDRIPELDPNTIVDVMMGTANPAGAAGYNIAKIVNVLLGMDQVPGVTVNRFCSSSLQTARMAMHAIRAGEGDVFIASGVDTVSQYGLGSADGAPNTKNPLFEEAMARTVSNAERPQPWTDPRIAGLLPDPYIAMGQTAENVASIRGVTRRHQDEFAVGSQNKAEKAINNGFYAREITPVTMPDGTVVDKDDCPRPGTTYEAVAALNPVFRENGTVTAGNCTPRNDGAAALVIMSDTKAKELGLTPLARIVATGVSGLSPEIMGLGPVGATQAALKHAGMTIKDLDLYEINEAFAAQVIASAWELEMDFDKLNTRGGAIALGHPYGQTGARLATTLINALQTDDKQFGLETMCVGGGQGMAMILERLS